MNFLSRALVVLMALSPLACSAADDAPYKFGEHYSRVRAAVAPANPDKIEVTEVFAYSCPHCYTLEPALEKWLKKKPADVEFVRLPHTLGRGPGALHNKAFYTARMLGVSDPFHLALFGAIHTQHKPMGTVEEIRALFVQSTGVKAEDFDAAFSGFAVDAGFRRGEIALQSMAIGSVPTLVVNGQYFTSGGMAPGGLGGMLKVTDFLIEKARKERGKR
jgi:protein dithiol oxidoreductase (disulfide-forming)